MGQYERRCRDCGQLATGDERVDLCARCGGLFDFHYDLRNVSLDRPLPGIWRFFDLLPLDDPAHLLSLGEGNTPLLPARLSDEIGTGLWWKWEGVNPTGAQKDRGLAVAIAKGKELGYSGAIIASTGSAGLSSAAYAARAGMQHVVLVSRGAPLARVIPMAMLGSSLFEVDGTIEETLDILATATDTLGIYETTTYRKANPYQSEGAKTLGYEIFLQHGGVPDWIVIPVGGGGTLGAVWRAFQDLRALGLIDKMPKLAGVQPADYNGLQLAMEQGLRTDAELRALTWNDVPPTILVKLAHTFPHDGVEALAAIRESGGAVCIATDDEALQAQRRIGASEGLYVEPSSSVVLTAIDQLTREGQIRPDEQVVAVLTGSGHRETHLLAERETFTIDRMGVEEAVDRLASHFALAARSSR